MSDNIWVLVATLNYDEQMTDDNFSLSDGATLTQDELGTGKSQMDAVDMYALPRFLGRAMVQGPPM